MAGKYDTCAGRLNTWQEVLTGRFDLTYSRAGRVHSWQADLTWEAGRFDLLYSHKGRLDTWQEGFTCHISVQAGLTSKAVLTNYIRMQAGVTYYILTCLICAQAISTFGR